MAANLADHMPIMAVGTKSGNQPQINAQNEKASQTFLAGTPVELSAGVVRDWDGATIAIGIAGITKLAGSNYASDGLGAPAPFGSVTGTPGITFGSVQNQASAKNIVHGAPFFDGRTIFEVANTDSIFIAQIDNGAAGAYASTQAQIGSQFGLTKDATGHWYIDLNKTTVGVNTVLTIVGFYLDPIGTNGARALFQFLDTVCQVAV